MKVRDNKERTCCDDPECPVWGDEYLVEAKTAADLAHYSADEVAVMLLELLNPPIPEDRRGIVVCNCGCGAWRPDDGSVT